MDTFLGSFEDNVTLQTGTDSTFLSVDHTAGAQTKQQLTTPVSPIKYNDLEPELRKLFDDYQRDGYVYLGKVLNKSQLQHLQRDTRTILDKVDTGQNKFYG